MIVVIPVPVYLEVVCIFIDNYIYRYLVNILYLKCHLEII